MREIEVFDSDPREIKLLAQIWAELRAIRRELSREPKLSQSSALQFSGDNMANNTLTLAVGQTSTASPVTFLSDGVTVSGATYSKAVYTFSDPSSTVVLNPDGVTALVTALAATTTPAQGSVTFTATDTDGAVSTWTNAFDITVTPAVVTPPPPTQLSQSSAVQFSDPNAPAAAIKK